MVHPCPSEAGADGDEEEVTVVESVLKLAEEEDGGEGGLPFGEPGRGGGEGGRGVVEVAEGEGGASRVEGRGLGDDANGS